MILTDRDLIISAHKHQPKRNVVFLFLFLFLLSFCIHCLHLFSSFLSSSFGSGSLETITSLSNGTARPRRSVKNSEQHRKRENDYFNFNPSRTLWRHILNLFKQKVSAACIVLVSFGDVYLSPPFCSASFRSSFAIDNVGRRTEMALSKADAARKRLNGGIYARKSF